jgi:hypothetical protein
MVIPDGVTTLESESFTGCVRLANISIPDTVTLIGEYSFFDNMSLAHVYYYGTEEQWNEIEVYECNDELLEARIHYHTHDWEVATCTEPETCSSCGKKRGEPLGHTVVEDAAVEATCTENGLTAGSHCSACKLVFVKQESIPTKEHSPVIDPAIPATCAAEGRTEGAHCGVCLRLLTPQTKLEKLLCIKLLVKQLAVLAVVLDKRQPQQLWHPMLM